MAPTNTPSPLTGTMGGSRPVITAKEAKARRVALRGMFVAGLQLDQITEEMSKPPFNMIEDDVLSLLERVKKDLVNEYDNRTPFNKAAASERISKHIVKAAAEKQFGAVANLEGQLAKIQGTEEPIQTHLTIDHQIQQKALHILSLKTPAELQELVVDELRHRQLTSAPFSAPESDENQD